MSSYNSLLSHYCAGLQHWFSGSSPVTWCISFGWLTISQRILRCVPTVISILPLSLVNAVLQLSLLQLGGKESPIAATPACSAFLCIVVQLLHISRAVAGWVNRLAVPLLLAGLCVAIVLVFVPPLGGPLVRCYMAVTVHFRWFFWSCAFDTCVLTAI